MSKTNNFECLQKVFIEFVDKENGYLLQYEQSSTNGEGLRHVNFPFDVSKFAPDKIKMKLF